MGFLYTIVFGNIGDSKARSRDDKRVSDVKQLQLAAVQFKDGCGEYPTALLAGVSCSTDNTLFFSRYLSQIPVDPKTNLSYTYITPAPGSSSGFCISTTFEVKDASGRNDNDLCDTSCTAGSKCYSVKAI